MLKRNLDRILVVIGVFGLFVIYHAFTLEYVNDLYTPHWMNERIGYFVVAPVILAALGLVRAALWSAFSYPVAILVGFLLGGPSIDIQEFLYEDRDPFHPGWAIAVGLFVWVTVGSALAEWWLRRRDRVLEADPQP